MPDSGDTGCPAVRGTGAGCLMERDTGAPLCEVPARPQVDTDVEETGTVIGGAGTCRPVDAVPPVWVGLLVVVVVLVRRWGALIAVLVSLLPVAHAGVDAQHVQILGGRFPALRDADLGQAWTASGTASLDLAAGLVRLVDHPRPRMLLSQVITHDYSATLNLAGVAQVGLTVPVHTNIVYDSVSEGDRFGDTGFWVAVPLLRREHLHTAWLVQVDIASGPEELYLGDPRGGVTGILSFSRTMGGRLEGLVNAGVRLQPVTPLPGVRWGEHWLYGVGVRFEPTGPTYLTMELQGSAPIALEGDIGAFPLETVTTVGARFGTWVSVGLGGGAGLTRGLGSPSWRLLAFVDLRRSTERDTDGDGILDFRDLCRMVPEDRDGYRDQDGCPDPDNDRDGILDPDDACPMRAEVFNSWEDDDGCPDAAGWLELEVLSPEEELEVAEVWLVGRDTSRVQLLEERFSVFIGEPVRRLVPGGSVEVQVTAPRHHTWTDEVGLWSGEAERVVRLEPVRYGHVLLRVTDEEGAPVPAFVQRQEGGLEAVPRGDVLLESPAGPREWTVHAEGFRPARVELEVVATELVEVQVVLRPLRLEVRGRRIVVREDVRFATDSDTLEPVGEAVLTEIASYLLQHPEIHLLRVEGHADDTGTSAYNYDLSTRRARAVTEWLARAGIDPERLQAVGTGEALPREDEDCTEEDRRCASRRVEFLVLVWEELRVDPSTSPTAPGG